MRKVLPGTPLKIAASTFNTMVDAAVAQQRRAFDGGNVLAPRDTKPGIVIVRNQSGADQGIFSVLGLSDVLVTPDQNLAEFAARFSFSAVAPTEDHQNAFVILQEPLRNNRFGKALLLGVTPVQVVRPAGNTDDFAGIDPDQTDYLKCGVPGAQMLWEDSYTAEEPHWALVRLPQGGGKGGLAGIAARAAATANVASLSGLQTVDGVALAAGDTVLLPWQTDKKANGTYKVGTGAWERTGDLKSDILVLVRRGAVNGHSIWMLVNETDPVIGVDDIQFEAMTAAFGGFSA